MTPKYRKSTRTVQEKYISDKNSLITDTSQNQIKETIGSVVSDVVPNVNPVDQMEHVASEDVVLNPIQEEDSTPTNPDGFFIGLNMGALDISGIVEAEGTVQFPKLIFGFHKLQYITLK